MTLCWAVKCGWSSMQSEWQETGNAAGNWCRQWTTAETSFGVAHPGLAAVKVACASNWLYTYISERQKLSETETA